MGHPRPDDLDGPGDGSASRDGAAPLDSIVRAALRRIALEAVERAVSGLRPAEAVAPAPGVLAEPRGAFVSLHVAGRLRGCVGLPRADRPLAAVVAEMAEAAALRDGRFPPLSRPDLALLSIEISVLSSLVRVTAPEEVRIGRDGLLVEADGAIGLLLPQVAVRCRFTAERFLAETAMKAGLPPLAWRRADVHRFSAEVF